MDDTEQPTEDAKKSKKAKGADPQPWDGSAHTEQFCALCQGYVNGNGCARRVCPVR